MKFHLSTSAGNVFTGYGDDYVRLGIVVYRENVVVTPERILTGWCPAGFDALTDADFAAVAELQPEIVLLGGRGCGKAVAFGPVRARPDARLPVGLRRARAEVASRRPARCTDRNRDCPSHGRCFVGYSADAERK